MKNKLLFYPENIRNGGKIFAYCQYLGIENITDSEEDGIIAVFFNHSNPECIYPKDETIIELSEKYKVYNLNCNNTRKSHVAKIHKEVFGYNADIEKGYTGKVFKKSEIQYQRNEEILDKTGSDPDSHYMKFIDTYRNKYFHNLRIPYFDGDIPCVIDVKRRHPYKRKPYKLEIRDTSHFLHGYDIRNIKKFCKKIGLDLGELDILRDRKDNKLYIIDVNDKPGFGMLKDDEIKKIFTEAFKKMIL